MLKWLYRRVNDLRLRWKMLLVVLPLVTVPVILMGALVGTIANRQAYRGITQTSKDDLGHMADFATDLINAHYQQFQVYKEDKKRSATRDLEALVNLAYGVVQAEERQRHQGRIDRATAMAEVRKALKGVSVGDTGYLYAMTSQGDLTVHVAQEGENIYDAKDENGRYFIREMCQSALRSRPGEVLHIVYPWRNALLGDRAARRKAVAYRYFKDWDWIVAAGGYLEESYEDLAFEKKSFEELKDRIKAKRVGRTGYIYAMTTQGVLTIHPDREGQRIYDERDESGRAFIREMCATKSGWIRYPWRNVGDKSPRMKIVRYEYFPPWDWIVAVGSYEDEFYREANKMQGRIVLSMAALTAAVWLAASALVLLVAKVLTDPIEHMIGVIRQVKRGRLDVRMEVRTTDEFGELAAAFNRMTDIIRRNREMETSLAQNEKMASLGVLSSGVAHEINNPLGVILGYAGYLEGKIDPSDPNLRYVQEIKRESKRCKKIVQDLLSYARTPKPLLEETDLNVLLDQIVDFAANHADMRHVKVVKAFTPDLPPAQLDPDQIRQVAMNLILNAGAAMEEGGTLTVSTYRDDEDHLCAAFQDDGAGIPAEHQERVFEPFFTTKTRGTGLGLAITKRIVESHLGTIGVVSEVGRGTTVTVRLPLNREEF
ncbi:MAG: cache domain-containing protein [Deltaproteobacteria bacterium]|nr:cache domain-containing protein [Deltaproteobacteria bacterium]